MPTKLARHSQWHACLQATQWVLIQAHEALLAPIVTAFYSVDRGRTGLLSAPQFAEFCRQLNAGISDREINVLLSSMLANTDQSVSCLVNCAACALSCPPGMASLEVQSCASPEAPGRDDHHARSA